MTPLLSIERELRGLGYEAAAMHRHYSFADVLAVAADTRADHPPFFTVSASARMASCVYSRASSRTCLTSSGSFGRPPGFPEAPALNGLPLGFLLFSATVRSQHFGGLTGLGFFFIARSLPSSSRPASALMAV